MASRTGVEVEGLEQVIASLERLERDASKLEGSFQRAGELVVNEAKALAPVLSGALAASIIATKTDNAFVITAGAGLAYAGVIHYGGYNNIKPQPFLTTAIEHQTEAITRMVNRDMAALIAKHQL